MTITIHATFDGQVFRPDQPPALSPNARVEITIKPVEEKPPPKEGKSSFLALARTLRLEGPPDWSKNLHDYLYHGKKFPDDE